MGMKKFNQLAVDSTQDGPFIMDWKKFYNGPLMRNYIRQPLVARKLNALGSGTLVPVDFDGKRIMEIPTLSDVDDPEYEFEPGVSDTGLEGELITAYMPQIYKTLKLGKDQMKMMFAGQARLPLAISQILEKIATFEDQKAFQGKAKVKVNGLIGSDSYDLGSPTGSWANKTATTNVLDNAVDDVNKALAYFDANGLQDKPVDMVISSYLKTKMDQTRLLFAGGNNTQYIQASLRGGVILSSNNIQASVSSTSNSALFIVRDPNAWQLMSTGIDQEQEKVGLWSWRYGLREKFSVKVLNNKYVAYMDGITTA